MEYKLFDSHCHPQFPQYDADREAMLHRATVLGIGMVCVGTDLVTSRGGVELAGTYEGVYASVGVHPNEELEHGGGRVDQVTTGSVDLSPDVLAEGLGREIAELRELAASARVVAIGETGLDFYRTTDTAHRLLQQRRFEAHLRLACELRLPVIVHTRDSAGQAAADSELQRNVLEMLKQHARICGASDAIGVVHSFTGTMEQARAYMAAGYLIGLNAIATFSSQYAEMVRCIPMNKLLLETDAPYLAPAPYRGKRNEPSFIVDIARQIATIREESLDQLVEETTKNALRLFKILSSSSV